MIRLFPPVSHLSRRSAKKFNKAADYWHKYSFINNILIHYIIFFRHNQSLFCKKQKINTIAQFSNIFLYILSTVLISKRRICIARIVRITAEIRINSIKIIRFFYFGIKDKIYGNLKKNR